MISFRLSSQAVSLLEVTLSDLDHILIELSPCISLLINLTVFQGHRELGKENLRVVIFRSYLIKFKLYMLVHCINEITLNCFS